MEKKLYIKEVVTGTYFYVTQDEGGFTTDIEQAKSYTDHAYVMVDFLDEYLKQEYFSGKILEIVEYYIIY